MTLGVKGSLPCGPTSVRQRTGLPLTALAAAYKRRFSLQPGDTDNLGVR